MKRLLAIIGLLSAYAFGQGSVYTRPVITSTAGVPGAAIYVCSATAVGNPCTPQVTIYSNATLTTPVNQPIQSDANGNFSFFCSPGNVQVQVTAPNPGSETVTYLDTCPGTGGGGGSGNVSTNPTTNQIIVQPVGTIFASTNIAGIPYALGFFNWIQTPSGSLSAANPSTVTLAPCPQGVNGSDTRSWYYITDGVNSEAVLSTGGGTCSPGSPTGTIAFTPQKNHSAGYSIGSGTAGITETINSAGLNVDGASVVIPPGTYALNAPIVVQCQRCKIDASGATLVSGARGPAGILGDLNNVVLFRKVEWHGGNLQSAIANPLPGGQISNVACTTSACTVTTTGSHGYQVNDFVANKFITPAATAGLAEGYHQITAVTSNTYTFSLASAGISSTPAFGVGRPRYLEVSSVLDCLKDHSYASH